MDGRPSFRKALRKMPLRASLLYMGFSLLWIIASDLVLERLLAGLPMRPLYMMLKGGLFVTISGGLLYIWARFLVAGAGRREARLVADKERSRKRLEATGDALRVLIMTVNDELRHLDVLSTHPSWARVPLSPLLEQIRQTATTVPGRWELVLETTGGSRVLEVTLTRVQPDTGIAGDLLCVVDDVTDMRSLQRDHRATRKLLQSVIDSSPMAIFAMDTKGKVQMWSKAAERLFGWTAEEVVGRLPPMVPADQFDEVRALFLRALDGELITDIRRHRLRKDGSVIQSRATLSPNRDETGIFGVVALVEDLTETAGLQRELHKYRLLAQHTPEIILFIGPDGRILDANPAAAAAYGYSLDELRCLNCHDLAVEGSESFGSTQSAQVHGTPLRFETVHRRKDGTLLPVEVSSVSTRAYGQVVVLSLVRDISRRRRQQLLRDLLHRVDRAVLLDEPIAAVLNQLCAELTDQLQCRYVGLHLLNGEGLDLVAATDPSPAELHDVVGPWGENTASPPRLAIGRRESVQAQVPLRPEPEGEPSAVVQALSLPIRAHGQAFGALTLLFDTDRPIHRTEQVLLEYFALQLGASMKQVEHQRQMRLLRAALTSTTSAVVITDRGGRIEWVNPAFTRLTGYALDEVKGQTPRILQSGAHSARFYETMWQTMAAGQVWRGEIRNRRKNGTVYDEEQTITPVLDSRGVVTHFVGVKRDLTMQKRAEQKLLEDSSTDGLTGLANRRVLEQRLTDLSASLKAGQQHVLVSVDIDQFKSINEGMGFHTGDRLLLQVAGLLTARVGEQGLAVRLGDDEFAALLVGYSEAEALAWTDEFRRDLSLLHIAHGEVVHEPTASMGLTVVRPELAGQQLLLEANRALMEAKEQGGNRVAVFSSELEHSGNLALWASRIRQALRTGAFELHYQPVVRLIGRAVTHVEALIRLRPTSGALVLPAEFIPMAERLHLMPLIDRWVTDTVLAQLRANPHPKIFVNLSGQSLGDTGLLEHISEQLRAEPDLASRITFEITETAAVRNLPGARQWMNQVHQLGGQFALDDFGSGFTSFTYLRELPAVYLKLDGSFVRSVEQDQASRAMVRAMVDVAHSLGKTVIAEWVENECIATLLATMGVEYGQGYGLGRPCPEFCWTKMAEAGEGEEEAGQGNSLAKPDVY